MAKKSTERVRRYRERQKLKSLVAQTDFQKHLAEMDPFDAQVMQSYWDTWKGKIPGVTGRDRLVALDRIAEWRRLIRNKDQAPTQALQVIFETTKEEGREQD
jgi:hypothetical protein